MRDQAGARFELLQQIWFELQIDVGQKIHGHHRRGSKIDGENVLLADLRQVLHAGFANIFARLFHEIAVDLEADGASAFLGRGDDDPAVARAHVVDHIALFYTRQLDHLVDDFLRRWNKGDDLLVIERGILRVGGYFQAYPTWSQREHDQKSCEHPAADIRHFSPRRRLDDRNCELMAKAINHKTGV